MVNGFKKAIENLYDDVCKIYELNGIKDETTKITSGTGWTLKHNDIKCRLSYKDLSQAVAGEPQSQTTKVIKLFMTNEIVVKPGSKIEVTHKGKVFTFRNSGEPSVYSNHQEIILEAGSVT